MLNCKVLFILRVSIFSSLWQSLLCASHGHCQQMDNLCSICVLCQRVWARSSAKPHTSAQLLPELFDLALASQSIALPPSPFASTASTGWISAKAIPNYPSNPQLCPRLPANTAWLSTTHRLSDGDNTTQTTRLRGGLLGLLLCCRIPCQSRGKQPKFMLWLGCSH